MASPNCSTRPYQEELRKALVINSGGTWCMKRNKFGEYEPASIDDEDLNRTLEREFGERNGDGFFSLNHRRYTARFKLVALPELLDSSNMNAAGWKKIAECVKENYNDYDGFVIIHGTDTMAYSASVLSFILRNLKKPVVVTGSQIPVFEHGTDGIDNLKDSVYIAAKHSDIPEVMLCFNGKAFRGNRTIKIDSDDKDAFASPFLAPLVHLTSDESEKVDCEKILNPGSESLKTLTEIDSAVGVLRFYPGITMETVKAFLQSGLRAVVLQTYGKGNGPSNNRALMDAIKEAFQDGVLIINISQCNKGKVEPTYATGSALAKIGVIPGGDMTTEAAFAKILYILSHEDAENATLAEEATYHLTEELFRQRVEKLLTNQRGEITQDPNLQYTVNDLVEKAACLWKN